MCSVQGLWCDWAACGAGAFVSVASGCTLDSRVSCCCWPWPSSVLIVSSWSSSAWLAFSRSRYFLLAFLLLLAFFFFPLSAFRAARLSSPMTKSSILSANMRRAILRFWVLERVSWHFITIPVGRCFSCTAEEVLLIFWPPGPVPLRKASVMSVSRIVGRGGSGF